jgi:carboxyl-terminal processing protease
MLLTVGGTFFMIKNLFILFFLLTSLLYGAKLPEITDEDAGQILSQMMRAHVAYKKLSLPLLQRTLQSFLEELDPMKCYFLESEVQEWIEPTPALLEKIKEEIERDDFSVFFAIHSRMEGIIPRRTLLEKKTENMAPKEKISVDEFKDSSWAKDEEELTLRLLYLRELQNSALEKLDASLRSKAIQRIQKRQKMREEELLSPSITEQKRLILSHTLKAFASSFDTHTAYFTPLEASQFMIQVQQRLFGIGVQLRDDITGFRVIKMIEGGPASKNPELKEGDLIIAIDAEPIVGLDLRDAVELIRGTAHTAIQLTLLREVGGEEITLTAEVMRDEVVIKEARLETRLIPFGDGMIAHFALHAFYQDPTHSSASDIAAELAKIQAKHRLKGVVLDLRTNAGGVLPQAVAVAGLFITKGIVVSIKDNDSKIEHLRNVDGKMAYDGPLIITTSKASASASEIVAQTLQDYGRAIVVGDEHTFGKGSFQTFTYDTSGQGNVNPKGEFKVTRGRYYTVSGKSPQLVGVKPDIIVPGSYSEMEIGEQYTKYPLDTDQIPPNFDDNLSDIEPRQRAKIDWLYKLNLQTKLTTYTKHIENLRQNSSLRMTQNRFYQKVLTELKKKEESNMDFLQTAHEADMQLQESINILQDLIVLLT